MEGERNFWAGEMASGNRAIGEVRLTFERDGKQTFARDRYETGGLRARFPDTEHGLEAVLINTGGGVAGGDRLMVSARLGEGAAALLSTQSAEKIYRAEAAPSEVSAILSLAARSSLAYLPQETILFDGARLRRSLDVEMAGTATFTGLEQTVFGRLARGERLTNGQFLDRWRIRRDGRLIFADHVHLEGEIADQLDRPAIGGSARAIATLIHVAPDAPQKLPLLRQALARQKIEAGATALDGFVLVRFVAADPALLRQAVIACVTRLLRRPMPRVWNC